jgi:hypothetical protein
MKSSGFVFNLGDLPLNGRSVYMHVQWRKKDGNLRWRSIIAWLDRPGVQDSAIGRRDDYVAVSGRLPFRVSKEERHEGGQRRT